MFSVREKEIIRVIGGKKMTIEQITDEVFIDVNPRPFDAKISIGNSIRRINDKCKHFELNWLFSKARVNNKLVIHKEKI